MNLDERFSETEKDWLQKWNIDIPYKAFKEAMTHPNYKNLHQNAKDFERLEFLGDAVLDLIIADQLFSDTSDYKEGEMTSKRSKLVNNDILAFIFDKINLDRFIRIEENFILPIKNKADFIEAIIGAIFHSNSYKDCVDFWNKVWEIVKIELKKITIQQKDELSKLNADLSIKEKITKYNMLIEYETLGLKVNNPISMLQELCQANKMPLPIYNVIKTEGPDDKKVFTVEVIAKPFYENPEVMYRGLGISSKIKKAERAAAINLCKKIFLPFN